MEGRNRMDCWGRSGFGYSPYSESERARIHSELMSDVEACDVQQRKGFGSSKLSYLEHHRACEIANRIFGPDGWSCSVERLSIVYSEQNANCRWEIGVFVQMSIMIQNGARHTDIGWGDANNMPSRGDAFEKAIKQACSDARKRALRIFGRSCGLSLYDKRFLEDIQSNAKRQKTASPAFNMPATEPKKTSMPPSSSSSSPSLSPSVSNVQNGMRNGHPPNNSKAPNAKTSPLANKPINNESRHSPPQQQPQHVQQTPLRDLTNGPGNQSGLNGQTLGKRTYQMVHETTTKTPVAPGRMHNPNLTAQKAPHQRERWPAGGQLFSTSDSAMQSNGGKKNHELDSQTIDATPKSNDMNKAVPGQRIPSSHPDEPFDDDDDLTAVMESYEKTLNRAPPALASYP